jgi:hypothetical protein
MGNILDLVSWKSASGLKAYWLTTDMFYGPKGGENLTKITGGLTSAEDLLRV